VVACERVLRQLPVARLEDVQGDDALGQQNHVLEWEERDPRRHIGNILDGGFPRRDPARPWILCCAPS
jgi:hypothetical protein